MGATRWTRRQVTSMWLSDTILGQISRSTLAQVMACCLTASSHYLNQWWLVISKVQGQPAEIISHEITQPSVTKSTLKITDPKFHLNLPGANELRHERHHWYHADNFKLQLYEGSFKRHPINNWCTLICLSVWCHTTSKPAYKQKYI